MILLKTPLSSRTAGNTEKNEIYKYNNRNFRFKAGIPILTDGDARFNSTKTNERTKVSYIDPETNKISSY